MFCPKCGVQNLDDLQYCRECGEELKIISQVMKKHLPIALVSKLDAVIERKNERFRRDAVLTALMGTVFLITAVFALLGGSSFPLINVLYLFAGIFALLSAAWNFLAYGRSLELKPQSAGASVVTEIPQIAAGTGAATKKLDAAGNIQGGAGVIYCPNCGLQNSAGVLYCPACGTSLDFDIYPKGMERYLPAFLLKKLDARIDKNEKTEFKAQYKSGWTILVIALLYLFIVIGNGMGGHWGNAAVNLVLGFVMVIGGGWSLIAYRRNPTTENEPLPERGSDLKSFLNIYWKRIVWMFGVALFGLGYFGIKAGGLFALFPVIVIVAMYLNFGQNSRLLKDKEYMPEISAIPTRELSPLNDLPPAPPPLSVTDSTTTLLPIPSREEKARTTRNLEKPLS